MGFERIGLGAVVTANTKPLVTGLGRAHKATVKFTKTVGRSRPPLSGFGSTVSRTATRLRGLVFGVRGARDEMGRFTKHTYGLVGALKQLNISLTGIIAKFAAMGAMMRRGGVMIASGLRNVAMGAAPMALALGWGVKKAVDFEKQMSAVGAVTLASAENMRELEKEARRQGIVSVYTATQAAEAQEQLGRAGFSTSQIMKSLSGIINAASADELDLASAADIVTTIIKGMNIEAEKSGHIADVLALASASAKTDIRALGESFVYGVSTAKQWNMTVEETTAIFGKLADAGLKGSMAGTTFTRMMGKLAKPSKKATAYMKKWGIQLEDKKGKLLKISNIIDQFNSKMTGYSSVLQRNNILTEMWGIRGGRAFSALMTAGGKALTELEKKLIDSSEAFGGIGAAAEMARRRLDNVWGASILLKSSLESLAISLFKKLLNPLKDTFISLTDRLNAVLFIMMDLEEEVEGVTILTEGWAKAIELLGEKGARSAYFVAKGFSDAGDDINRAWTYITDKFKAASVWLKKTFGDDGLRSLTRIATLFVVIAGTLTPIILALAMVKWLIGGLISVMIGFGMVLLPLLIPLGILALHIQSARKEGESFYDSARRVFTSIKNWIVDVYNNALLPLWRGFREVMIPVIEDLGRTWDAVAANFKAAFSEVYKSIFGENAKMEISWKEIGQIIGAVLGIILKFLLVVTGIVIPELIRFGADIIKFFKLVGAIIDWLITPVTDIVAKFVVAFSEIFSGNILTGLKRLGLMIVDFVLLPIQYLVKVLLALTDVLSIDVPESIRSFAKGGYTELYFPTGGKKHLEYKTKGEMYAAMGISKGEYKGKKLVEPRGRKAIRVGTEEYNRARAKELTGIDLSKRVAESVGEIGAKRAGAGMPKINFNPVIENKLTAEIENKLCVEGEELNIASSRHRKEISERAGFKTTPWQRRAMLEHGAVPFSKVS